MRDKLQHQSHAIDLLFTLALFCVFAATLLMVVTIGADVYKRISDSMEQNFDLRTSLSYVSEKIRQNDEKDAVSIGSLGGQQALILEQTIGDALYRTYIYYDDGALQEIFTAADLPVTPQDGQRITDLAGFSIEQAGANIYRITCMDQNGRQSSVLAAPRSR